MSAFLYTQYEIQNKKIKRDGGSAPDGRVDVDKFELPCYTPMRCSSRLDLTLMNEHKVLWAAFGFLLFNCVSCVHPRTTTAETDSCSDYPARSAELQTIVTADQADRQGSPDAIDWSKVHPRDLERKARVAEIFAEGCFRTAADYSAAALVYQHGDTADDVHHTFLWAKKAVDLGDSSQKWLTVAGLDRYLVRTAKRQLFATQYGKYNGNSCWCLEPVESAFPESERIEWAGVGLNRALERLRTELNQGQPSCDEVQYCPHDPALNSNPTGSIPGFW